MGTYNEDDEEAMEWSPWLDFNQSGIAAASVPELPGAYKMHASMKILYIGSSTRLILGIASP
jgi:hypothetical protein